MISIPSLERWTAFGVDCLFVTQSVSLSLVSTWTSLTSGRAILCCKKNTFQLDVSRFASCPLRLIIASAADESHHKICCVVSFVSTALPPNFNDQFHCCRKPMPSQAPRECSNQLNLTTAECDCRLLLARRRDRVPTKFALHP